MALKFLIDRNSGTIRLGNIAAFVAYQHVAEVEGKVGNLISGSRDYGNGFAWLDLQCLTFGGHPASLSLCFHNGLLKTASWNIRLPGAAVEGGWPTRDAIDAEVAFVRETLATEMNIDVGRLAWGEVWSSFDAKAFIASNGLRYSRA